MNKVVAHEKGIKKVVTHGGMFHADDAVGAGILYLLFEEIKIERTRDLALINKYKEDRNVFVLDIGHEYDAKMNNFDHHQKYGAGERENGVPYATAGLVWKSYGRKVIESMYPNCKYTQSIFCYIDENIMQGVDAWDNAILRLNTEIKIPVLPSIVGSFNPISGQEDTDRESFLAAFWKAVELMSDFLERQITSSFAFYSNKSIVNDAIAHSEDGVLILNRGVRGWQSQVLQSEKNIDFCVFPSFEGGWMIHTVPNSLGSTRPKLPFPKNWGGKNGRDLDKEVGIKDTVFCHSKLFIAGHKNKSGAIEMAKRARNGLHR